MTTGSSIARALTAAAVLTVGALVLTGCSGGGTGHDAAEPTSTVTAGVPAQATPTISPTPTATPVGSPVDVPCATIVPESAFAAYGKTFTLDTTAPKPAKGTAAATIVAQRGTVCSWTDAADAITITVAVASLPADALTHQKDALFTASNSVPTYTVEGYFAAAAGTGTADAFQDPYWIDASSTMFGEPGDAEPVMDAAVAALAG